MSDDFDNNNDFNNNDDDYGQKPIGFFKGKYVGKSYDANFEFGNLRKKAGSGGNGDDPNGNKNNNNGKKHGVMFWAVFVILFLISAALFTASKNTVIGWVSLIVIFVIAYFLKNFLSKRGCLLNIIIWVLILFLIFIVFAFSLPKDSSPKPASGTSAPAVSANTSNTGFKNLQFSKTYNFPNSKGFYTLKISTENNSYVIKIYVQVPKEIIPAGFKWNSQTVTEQVYRIPGDELSSSPATDIMSVCWKSAGVAVERGGKIGPLGPATNFDIKTMQLSLKDYSDTTLYGYASSLEELKTLMRSGDTLDIYWYNLKEVGFTDVKKEVIGNATNYSATIMQWKGYGLHPNIASAEIPWGAIMTELGIK